jgi:hypothetical protein
MSALGDYMFEKFIWPKKRIVHQMIGSLPMGGAVTGSPIYAFEVTPDLLKFTSQPSLQTRKNEIDLGGKLAFLIDDVITDSEANHIIAASEILGYREDAPGIATPPGMRMNKSVHWIADESMLGLIMSRMRKFLPIEISGHHLHSELSHRINMYRYDNKDVFKQHIDGDWPGYGLDESRTLMNEWPGYRSCLTMLLYLNGPEDGVQGGHTKLLHDDGYWVDIIPKKGSALFFRHGFGVDSVSHIGDQVIGDVSKYVARVNVMYS